MSSNKRTADVISIPLHSKRAKKEVVAVVTPDNQNEAFVGMQVAKRFIPEYEKKKTQLYYGKVGSYNHTSKKWKIVYNDGDCEFVARQELMEMLKEGKPKKFNDVGIEFVHFCHYRQLEWVRCYSDRAIKETHYTKESIPLGPFESDKMAWKLTQLCTFGNVYRHLDTATDKLGLEYIPRKLGLEGVDAREWDKTAVQGAFIMALMQMAGFLEHKIRHAFKKNWNDLDVNCCLPSSCEELKKLSKSLKSLYEQHRPIFADKYQTQGLRWIKYLAKWTQKEVETVVNKARGAKTWKMASLALEELPGIGPYSSSQALCTVFFGVFQGGKGLFDNHDQVVATMKDCTGWGPGPKSTLNQIFPGVDTNDALVMLTHSMDAAFEDEGLDFPYLQDENGERRSLSCVDVEHIACYFHRYRNAKALLGHAKIQQLYDRFQDPNFRKTMRRKPSIKRLEMPMESIDAFCEQLCTDDDQEDSM